MLRIMGKLGAAHAALALVFALPSVAFGQGRPGLPTVKLVQVATGFVSPVTMVPFPDGTGRMAIVDQIGIIKVMLSDGTVLPDPFLDVISKMVTLNPSYDERGLLGLAFHPNYVANGRFFVYYSAPLRPGGPDGWNHTSHIAEFLVSSDINKADPGSERVILQVDEPQRNHNGGALEFGPDDGYLYISLGDGGAANDTGLGHAPIGNGQAIDTLLGKILRIDVNNGNPYAIPPDNPFVNKDGLDEIFAYGFRNPYRMSFDRGGTHQFFVPDVGQNLFEEFNVVTKGGNYGWRIREGFHCFDPDNPNNPPETCRTEGYLGEPLIQPLFEYKHLQNGGFGAAIVAGYMYRGSAVQAFKGKYVFGDWSASFSGPDGTLLLAYPSPPLKNEGWKFRELKVVGRPNGRLGEFIGGVGQDANGEIYLLSKTNLGPTGNTGSVYKMTSG